MQNTATYLLGTKDEHIVAFMHCACPPGAVQRPSQFTSI
jgi:hypothetical protein